MKYYKGQKIIEASEKAYRLIYKEQGFEPYIEGVTNKEVDINKLMEAMDDMVEETLKKEDGQTETDKKEEATKKSNKSNKKDEKNGTDKSK